MKTFLSLIALASIVTTAHAAPSGRVAGPEDPLPVINIERKNNLFEIDKSKPIYLEINMSPKTSKVLKKELSEKGLNIVDQPADGVTIMKIEGVYTVNLQNLRAKPFHLDELLSLGTEEPSDEVYKSAQTQSSIRGGSDLVANVLVGSGSTVGLSTAGGITMALAQIVGLDVGLAKAFGGDPRGFCLLGCSNWNKYFQEMYVAVDVRENGNQQIAGIRISTIDDLMQPVYLWQVAFGILMHDLTGDALPAFNLKQTGVAPSDN